MGSGGSYETVVATTRGRTVGRSTDGWIDGSMGRWRTRWSIYLACSDEGRREMGREFRAGVGRADMDFAEGRHPSRCLNQ